MLSASGLRFVTYNVHRFVSPKTNVSTLRGITEALTSLNPRPDVIALNEVSVQDHPDALPSLAASLNMDYKFFGHVNKQYGNALLSAHPIIHTEEVHLRGGTSFEFPAGTLKLNGEVAVAGDKHRIVRGLLVADLDTGAGGTRVGVTHLDHVSIEERRTQLAHVVEVLGSGDGDTVLLGDLNALTLADYSASQWEALEKRAASKGWAPPESGDLDVLKQSGFKDAFVEADVKPQSPWFTASVREPMYRIDYAFVRSRSMTAKMGHVVNDATESDHFPVVVDLERSNESKL